MRLRALYFSAIQLLVFAILFAAASVGSDFPPVNPEELKITSLPNQPGAAAFILDHEETSDDVAHFRSVYMRIKVLTEAGRERANVELPYNDRGFDIAAVHGRTIHSDGTIIPFEGKPFEKVIVKGKDLRYKVKTFTMPDLQVGSIIEYKYELRYEDGMVFEPHWILQEDLFQKHLHFVFKPSDREILLPHGRVGKGLAWTWFTPNKEQPVDSHGVIAITLENVPAFVEDEYLPPENVLKYYVFFYYQTARSSEEFWRDEGKFWSKDVDHFAKTDAVGSALGSIVAPGDTPEQKVRKIYAFVQTLENTTYLPERSSQEQKALGLKESKNAGDVLRQKSGDRDEITHLFIALVRAAGIPAYAMRVTSRDSSYFLPQLMDFNQLDWDIAIVPMDGKEVFLDPGTRFCPYGMLYWKYSDARGLREDPDGKTSISASAATSYKDAQIQRLLVLKAGMDGKGEGTLKVSFTGQEAIRRRLRGIKTDAAGRTKQLEDEAKSWFPENAEISLSNQPDWNSDKTLYAEFKVNTPLMSSAGKHLLLPADVMVFYLPERFPHADRKYPVYFDYPYVEMDEVHVQLPDGLQVDTLPSPANVRLPYAAYVSDLKQGGREVVVSRQLAMGGNVFQVNQYPELRDFYLKARNSDQQQILLKVDTHVSGN
ncbi:MAG TPA: DUF3857 domain-containing protein [Terriglobales bacterium]|nr:DUF3857 domain-containing protein [Terriglobales bacterium]